ncbi:hypothetical protein GCM10027589_29530 [Actinocorallia lasiicapitis]
MKVRPPPPSHRSVRGSAHPVRNGWSSVTISSTFGRRPASPRRRTPPGTPAPARDHGAPPATAAAIARNPRLPTPPSTRYPRWSPAARRKITSADGCPMSPTGQGTGKHAPATGPHTA